MPRMHPEPKVPVRRLPIMAAALVATFLVAMEYNVVATAMPSIVGALGGMELFSWVFAAYVATTTITTPIYGKLADLYGRKRVLLAGTGIFLLGSTLCAFAPGMPGLVAFRAIQGAGAGSILPVVLTIIGDLFSVEERARYQGILGSVWGFSALVGPALGAGLVATVGWRWVFLINLPVGLTALALLVVYLPEVPAQRRPQLDWAGVTLLTGAVAALMIGTAVGGAAGRGWGDTTVASLLLAAAVLAVAFVWQERRAPEPLLPLELFRVPMIAVSSLANVFFGVVLITCQVYVPMFASAVQGASLFLTAVVVAALSIGWPVASWLGARLILTLGYRTMAIVGQAVMLVAVMLLRGLGPGSPVWESVAVMLLLGGGFGLCNPSYLIGVQNAVPWQRRGVATSTLTFVRALGQTGGSAILGTIFSAMLLPLLAGVGAAGAAEGGQALESLDFSQMEPATVRALQSGLNGILDHIFTLTAVAAVVGLLITLAMPRLLPGQEEVLQSSAAPGAEPAPGAE